MNILLWVLQVLAALLYAASGVVKVFMFDKVSVDVPCFWCVGARSLDGPVPATTEAEWDRARQAGTTTPFGWGNGSTPRRRSTTATSPPRR
jgi:hypothetical protein